MADTSNTSTSVGIVLNGKDNASAAFESATRSAMKFGETGIGRLNEKLEQFKSSLRGFNAILELGFGFQIGRKIFDQMHEGVRNLAEGFIDARKEGEGFASSLADGMRKVVGLRTEVDKLKDSLLKSKESEKEFKAAFAIGEPKEEPRFKDTLPAGQADEKLRALKEAQRKAVEAAAEAHQELDAAGIARQAALRISSNKPATFSEAMAAGYSFFKASNIFTGAHGTVEAVKERYKDVFGKEDRAAGAVAQYEREAEESQAQAKRVKDNWAKWLSGPVGTNDTWSGFGKKAELAAGGAIGSVTSKIGDTLNAGFRFIDSLGRRPNLQRDPSLPDEINDRILALDRNRMLTKQQKSIEAAKIAQSFGSYFGIKTPPQAGSVGAENQRFTTLGSGNVRTPELTALEQIQKAMEELGREKLPDLIAALKAFGPIGVIDN